MSIDRFFRRPAAPDRWQSRARAIQSQLEGLSIDELMRGAMKQGQPAGRGAHEYDPNQPRVPAGHSDGGQWTSTGADRAFELTIHGLRQMRRRTTTGYLVRTSLRADTTWMPREYYLRLPVNSRETRKVFRDATSGTLPQRIYSEDRFAPLRHQLRRRPSTIQCCRRMNYIKDYMMSFRITPQQMTPDQARKFLQIVHEME